MAQYAYDHAGNRLTAKEGGGGTIATLGIAPAAPWDWLTSSYTPNALNQYSGITNASQKFDVTGVRTAGAAVNVTATSIPAPQPDLAASDYQPSAGTYYAKRITHNSGANGLYESVTVTEAGATVENGTEYVPPPTAAPTYDLDGNLTNDGRWTYTWDGENRLVTMTSPGTLTSANPAVSGKRLTFTYDALSRRISKKVETQAPGTTLPNNNAWVFSTAEAYLYDGWNLIMTVELNSSNAPVRRTASYIWGPDMASAATAGSSWQAAGGVGGLVMVLGNAANLAAGHPGTADYAPLMDRMGNVTGSRKLASTGTVTQKALTANVATLTLSGSGAAQFVTGQPVTVAGVDTTFNGTWTVSSVTATTISYARTAANVAPVVAPGTASQGSHLAAVYEYDAFGRELRASGYAADFLKHRFSTKFTDTESGLVYYGYRFYHPGWGRWINRDPIGERGGMNLLQFAANTPTIRYDNFGLFTAETLLGLLGQLDQDSPSPFEGESQDVPGPLDHKKGANDRRDFSNPLDARYPNLIQRVKKEAEHFINGLICKTGRGKSTVDVGNWRRPVHKRYPKVVPSVRDEAYWGDPPQNSWESMTSMGSFAFIIKPSKIRFICEKQPSVPNGCCDLNVCLWFAYLEIEDVAGLQPDEPHPANQAIFPERRVIRARYRFGGIATCCFDEN